MKKPESPCLDCELRHPGCHAECETYITYKEAFREYTSIIKNQKIEQRRAADLQWLPYVKRHKPTQRPK